MSTSARITDAIFSMCLKMFGEEECERVNVQRAEILSLPFLNKEIFPIISRRNESSASFSFSYEKQLKANDSLTIFFLDLSNTHATGQSFSNEFFLPFSTPIGWNNLEGRVSRYSRRSIDDKIEPSKAGHFSPPHNSNYIGRNDRVRPGPEPEGTLHDCPEAVEDCASLAIFVHPAENCSSSF